MQMLLLISKKMEYSIVEIANRFKTNILSKGGTENPELLYEKFRGQKASIDALIVRSGLKQ